MPQVDPKFTFWFGVWTNVLMLVAGYGVEHAPPLVAQYAPTVQWFASLAAQTNSVILTALVGISSTKAGPLINVPAITPTVVKILFVAFVVSAFLATGQAQAQGLPKFKPLTGNIVNDIAAAKSDQAAVPTSGSKIGDSGCKVTGDPIADLHCVIKAGGAKLILHLKQSYALASAPGPTTGSTTDNTSAMCTKALVPIVDLVVNGPKPGTLAAGDTMAFTADETTLAANTSEPDGPIVIIEKIRILRLAIQSPALNDACGALVQDEVKNAQSLVGKITSLVTGAGILAPLGF